MYTFSYSVSDSLKNFSQPLVVLLLCFAVDQCIIDKATQNLRYESVLGLT